MATDTKERIYGYVSNEVKSRIQRITERADRSESWVISRCIETAVATIEREVGISEPVQRPRSQKAE